MRNTLVPVLLLAAVTLSSSNILPIVPIREEPDSRGYSQSDDNIFSSEDQTRDDTNDLYSKIYFENQNPMDTQELYINGNTNKENAADYDTDKDNYDIRGFRKEQWHNYPRQLDRLNKYLYDHFNSDRRNLDPDDPKKYNDIDLGNPNDKTSNENLSDDIDSQLVKETGRDDFMHPLIILKIHLAYLNNHKDISKISDISSMSDGELRPNENDMYDINNENLNTNAVKVKREGKVTAETTDLAQSDPDNRMVTKRIFSLWSRLQSLNHKGHELQHRRHLYALYGLPNSDGGGGSSGGMLTAETRAMFMRPPGSPLRWG